MKDPLPETPAQRRTRMRSMSNTRWAQEPDRTAATEPARKAFLASLAASVDPDNILPPDERQKRVDAALRAHMNRLAYKASRARQARRSQS